MQTIRTFGDSFLFGTDLSDCVGGSASSLTWPALIAEQLQLQHQCYAWGGASNSLIARRVIEHAYHQSLNVIQWSWIDRSEYATRDNNEFQQIRPSEDNTVNNFYYKHMHSELNDKWTNLMLIANTLQYLENNNLKYVCHVLDQTLFDKKYHAPDYVQKLQQYIEPKVIWFPGHTTFFEWAKLERFPISDTWHPLEPAHEQACTILKDIYERHCK